MPRAPATRLPARRFSCATRPAAKDDAACARTIASTLVKHAFRRPATQSDVTRLMEFYQSGRTDGGTFDDGIEAVLQRVLADPEFVYRLEPEPAGLLRLARAYRISDLALASRCPSSCGAAFPTIN